MLEPDLTADATYRLLGVPVTITNELPEGTVILADMSNMAIARDVSPSVTVLTERYAEYDQVGLRVVIRHDLGLLHPEAVAVLVEPGTLWLKQTRWRRSWVDRRTPPSWRPHSKPSR